MHDALDEHWVARIPTGEAFRARFGNPYAVIHRADVHTSLLEGAHESADIEILTSTTVQRAEQDDDGVTVHDAKGGKHRGIALIGADGVKSAVRRQYIGDDAPCRAMSSTVQWSRRRTSRKTCSGTPRASGSARTATLCTTRCEAASNTTWSSPSTAARRRSGACAKAVTRKCRAYFEGICAKARQLIDLPKDWKRWATADREPIAQWTFGRATLLGDAAHATLQYLAQGACMALEDAVTLGEALRVRAKNDFAKAFALYERSRVSRTARIVFSAREMGRIFHAKGVERVVRNDLWKGRTPERFYDAIEWLYGWKVENCLAA